MTKKKAAALAVLALLGTAGAQAQTAGQLRAADPGATQQRQMEEERRRREEEREQRRTIVEPLQKAAPEAPAVQTGGDQPRFLVREIRFTPSEILSAEELSAIAREYAGRELTLADLQELAGKVNALYRAKGVVTARAIVPAQDVRSGVVQIRLVEGRLGKIRLEGNETTRESYLVDRIRLQPGDLMDLKALEASLVRFNRTHDVQLQAELRPGEQFATTDLRLAVQEPPRHDLRVTLDNLGAESTGRERAGLFYLNRSLLGFRDDLSLTWTQAEGQASGGINYGFPVNTWGGRLSFGYFNDHTKIKNGAAAKLNLTGKSEASTVQFRQPTWVDSALEVDLLLGGKDRKNRNWIDNVFLSRVDTADTSVGVEASYFAGNAYWSASYSRAFGHADPSITDIREHYVIDRGSLRHQRQFDHGLSLRANLSWQSTRHDVLPSGEQFFIGGDGSVRGYPVGVYSGDNGQFASVELHHPLFSAENNGGVAASGFFFADYGRVKPYRAPNSRFPAHDQLTGVGWGMLATLGKNVQARLSFGFGLDEVSTLPRQYDITLQIIASAF